MENLRTNNPELESINVNSGRRPDERTEEEKVAGKQIDPHADGRAVDVSRINGFPVEGLEKAEGPGADKAKRAAENMVEQAKKDPNVNQVIGPNGGWNRKGKDWEPIEDAKLLNDHKDHYHINVYR